MYCQYKNCNELSKITLHIGTPFNIASTKIDLCSKHVEAVRKDIVEHNRAMTKLSEDAAKAWFDSLDKLENKIIGG